MSKPISELRKNMSTERQRRIVAKTEALKQEMALCELRQAIDLTQKELAERLNVNQAAISKFESQSDIYIDPIRKGFRMGCFEFGVQGSGATLAVRCCCRGISAGKIP